MREVGREAIPVRDAKAPVWLGGLLDVAAGWNRLEHGGGRPRGQRYSNFGAEFEEAERAPDESLVALVSTVGTKALLLEPDGLVVRELSRSYYHAQHYRHPLALFMLPKGRTGLVHCPNRYNQLELDGFGVFDLRGLIQAEVAGAAFVGGDVVVSTSDEQNDPDGPDDLGPNMLVRYSLISLSYVWRRELDKSVGDLLPMAGGVLSLQGHPRWHDPTTGVTAYEWPDLPTVGDYDYLGELEQWPPHSPPSTG